MIEAYTLLKDKVAKKRLDELNLHSGVSWIDLNNPTNEELKKVSLKTHIPYKELIERVVEDERPVTYEVNAHNLVIFRAPSNKPKVVTSTIATFISHRFIVTIRTDELDSIRRIKEYDEQRFASIFRQGPAYILFSILDEIMQSYFTIIDKIEEDIERLENQVFKNPERKLAERIFTIKKKMIYFHKALVADKEVALVIEKGGVKHIPHNMIKKFNGIVYDLSHLIDLETTLRDVLASTLDVYLSTVSNKLNSIVKTLTIVASFVLVPTLITGIYGMNFEVMPEIQWEYGYIFAWFLMIFSVVVMLLYFKKKRWM